MEKLHFALKANTNYVFFQPMVTFSFNKFCRVEVPVDDLDVLEFCRCSHFAPVNNTTTTPVTTTAMIPTTTTANQTTTTKTG